MALETNGAYLDSVTARPDTGSVNWDKRIQASETEFTLRLAEKAKKVLSSSSTTSINLPFITTVKGEPKHMEMTLTRAKFNELTKDLVERTSGPVQQALNDAGISASDLGMVLLVGGSTRIPAVYDEVTRLTGKEPSRNLNPDECVALGAAGLGG